MANLKTIKEEVSKKRFIVEKEIEEKSEYKKVKLSDLIETVISIKLIVMNPNQSLCRDKLYTLLSSLEHMLVDLRDVNIELERDWWE